MTVCRGRIQSINTTYRVSRACDWSIHRSVSRATIIRSTHFPRLRAPPFSNLPLSFFRFLSLCSFPHLSSSSHYDCTLYANAYIVDSRAAHARSADKNRMRVSPFRIYDHRHFSTRTKFSSDCLRRKYINRPVFRRYPNPLSHHFLLHWNFGRCFHR